MRKGNPIATPVVLQVLPALEGGGVERGTVEIAAALARAGGTALVASAGGRMAALVARAGGRNIALPLDTKIALGVWRNAGASRRYHPRRAGRDRARPLARPGLVGLARRPPHRRPFRHHLPRALRRAPAAQARATTR